MDPIRGDELIDLRFDTIETGMEFGPLELVVTDDLVKAFAFSTDDYAPLLDGRGHAHAAVLAPDLLRLLNTRFDANTMVGVHQREDLTMHSPVEVGETVVMTGRCAETYVRRGRGCFVMRATAQSADDGRLILSRRSVEIAEADREIADAGGASPPSTRRIEGVVDREREPVARAAPGLAPGTPVVPIVKRLTQAQMSVFSNVAWRSVHTDADQARLAGHPTTIAQGLMQTTYVSQLGTEFFGPAWFTSGRLSTTYLQPAYAGDQVTLDAVVARTIPDDDGHRLELEAWIEKPDGTRTTVGWLSARVEP